jgi:hypothetical protein
MLIFVAQFKVLPGIGEPNISNFSADFVANFGPDYSPQACSCKRSYFADASPIFFPKFAQIISIFSESTINLHANHMISRRTDMWYLNIPLLGAYKTVADNNPAARGNATVRETTIQARQARGVRFWWHG